MKFWFLLLIAKYLCLFSLKSILLGVFLFLCRFSIRILIRIYCLSWYSLIFFLVYIGGLLVLFIYISSLNYNPAFYSLEVKPIRKILLKVKGLLILLFRVIQIRWKFKSGFFKNQDTNNFSLNLFNEKELIFLVNVGLLLLLVLWVITKLSFLRRGALRPVY